MKTINKHKHISVLVIFLFVVIFIISFFYPHRLSNYILNSDITPNESVIGQGDLAENHTLSKEETEEILSLMDKTSVRFAGFNNGIILNKDEHTYTLLLINRGSKELIEFGNFTFDENGYVYTTKYKYKILGKNELMNIIKTNVNK